MSKPAVVAKPLRLNITVTKGPNQGPVQSFQQAMISVGRGPENSVVLAQDPKISRNHFELHVASNSVFFRNLSQRNGVAVNGEVVHEKVITGNATLAVGDSEISIELPDVVKEAVNLTSLKVVSGGATPPAAMRSDSMAPQGFQPAGSPTMPTMQSAGNGGFTTYQAAPLPPPDSPIKELFGNPKARFYMILGFVALVGFWLFSGNEQKKKQDLKLRDSVQSNEDFTKSEAEVQRLRDDPKFKAKDSIQYQKAEEHYWRAFRDYKNGQYARAMEGFQAALSFYPSHDLARRYYSLSMRKFDQMVQGHMVRGRQYYGKKNFSKCMAEFRAVVIMKKDPRDAVRKEALQLHDECRLRLDESR